jgi:hypothetical protein
MRALVVLSLLAAVATARADAPGLTPPIEPAPAEPADTGSYRLQTALCDVAAIGLFTIAANSNGNAAGSLGLGMYIAGAPVVHLYHHHNARALASVALRVGLPILGGLVGSALSSGQCTGDDCDLAGLAGALLGVSVGMVAASAIDIGYLSRGEDAPPQTQPALAPMQSPSVPIAPAEPHQVRVGMAFAF